MFQGGGERGVSNPSHVRFTPREPRVTRCSRFDNATHLSLSLFLHPSPSPFQTFSGKTPMQIGFYLPDAAIRSIGIKHPSGDGMIGIITFVELGHNCSVVRSPKWRREPRPLKSFLRFLKFFWFIFFFIWFYILYIIYIIFVFFIWFYIRNFWYPALISRFSNFSSFQNFWISISKGKVEILLPYCLQFKHLGQ